MKRTPLFEQHRARGARFVDFGGWEMPVQYTGIVEEHRAVRTRVGLFDVSHMGEIEVRGPHARDLVQTVTVNDVDRLQDGRAQYSLLCRPDGGIVDDILVHRLAADRFLLCVNASNTDRDFAWIADHAKGTDVVDRSDEFALLALQGPKAATVLGPLCSAAVDSMAPFTFHDVLVAGRSVLVARTGYTGEDGWEIYCAPGDSAHLWDALLEEGEPVGALPAGLGARDTLRLEAALPLYGHELTEETTPLEARLGWVVRLGKGEFIGRDALQRQRDRGVDRQLVGLTMTGRGIARQGYPILDGDETVGVVTSGTKSPTLGKAIGLGYVASRYREPGTQLGVAIRGNVVEAEVTPLPFYKRDR